MCLSCTGTIIIIIIIIIINICSQEDMVCLSCTGTGERVCLSAEGFGNRQCFLESIADKVFYLYLYLYLHLYLYLGFSNRQCFLESIANAVSILSYFDTVCVASSPGYFLRSKTLKIKKKDFVLRATGNASLRKYTHIHLFVFLKL